VWPQQARLHKSSESMKPYESISVGEGRLIRARIDEMPRLSSADCRPLCDV
jgi:hypothetical protein